MTALVATTARDLRTELITAASSMLTQPQPIKVPSLRSIARACEVAPSAVYWHFPCEADLREAVLDAEYSDMVNAIEHAILDLVPGIESTVAGAQAYVSWGLTHPGAYQLLFESDDAIPETRAPNGRRLQDRITSLLALDDPTIARETALALWSIQHGIVSLRLHKNHWAWGKSPKEATSEAIRGLLANSSL
jgi:AcrR family transcriptional regulator